MASNSKVTDNKRRMRAHKRRMKRYKKLRSRARREAREGFLTVN